MSRHEFPQSVKRAAVKRSGGHCEAIGERYGLDPGQRCNATLGHGLEIDHYPLPATDEGSDVLENAVVCCKTCHAWKTAHYDVPMQAKGKRVSDAYLGIARSKSGIRSAGFRKAQPQRSATRAIVRKSERQETT